MRVVAFDVGRRRTGVAVSDGSGTLARPLCTLAGADPAGALELIRRLAAEDDGLAAVIVGLPRRLDGSATELTPVARAFAEAIQAASRLPVALQDERLTSVEAEQRLAIRERSWRKRKAWLDAASAAIILQDYLDQHAGDAPLPATPEDPA